jgi:hypothetical protein
MTRMTWLSELEEELDPAPANPIAPVKATGPGVAEIKKHNYNGKYDGLTQLRNPKIAADRLRYLVTYLPLDASKSPTDLSGAEYVQVYAVHFPPTTNPKTKAVVGTAVPTTPRQIAGPWMNLGLIKLPKSSVWFPSVHHADQFGNAVEEAVRRRFLWKVVNPRPGGRKGYPQDIIWQELAEFYSELARELAPSGGSFRF